MERIPPGARLQIAVSEDAPESPTLVLNSIFVETRPDNYILFTTPIYEDAVYPLASGDILYVRYQTDDGIFNFSCVVISQPQPPYANNEYLIKARITSEINRNQYRGFYRMKIAVEGQAAIERDGDISVSDFLTHDISASGLFIYSNESFVLGDVVSVSLPAGDNGENTSFYAEVVWVRVSPRFDYQNCAGLNFIYESDPEREKMAKYVFDLQLMSIQRRSRRGR